MAAANSARNEAVKHAVEMHFDTVFEDEVLQEEGFKDDGVMLELSLNRFKVGKSITVLFSSLHDYLAFCCYCCDHS